MSKFGMNVFYISHPYTGDEGKNRTKAIYLAAMREQRCRRPMNLGMMRQLSKGENRFGEETGKRSIA